MQKIPAPKGAGGKMDGRYFLSRKGQNMPFRFMFAIPFSIRLFTFSKKGPGSPVGPIPRPPGTDFRDFSKRSEEGASAFGQIRVPILRTLIFF